MGLLANALLPDSGSARPGASEPVQFAQGRSRTVRISYFRNGVLPVLKARGTLERRLARSGVTVQWFLLQTGPQHFEALSGGQVDIITTGDAPPVFAQASRVPFTYLAHEPAAPATTAILVPRNSSIRTLADLKGKKVAFARGSSAHYVVVQALSRANLQLSDITPTFLLPSEARPAFERGSVDAWAIWDPFYASMQRSGNVRVLTDGRGLVQRLEFYHASPTFVRNNPEIVRVVLDELRQTGAWINNNQRAAARILSPELGIDVQTLELAYGRIRFGLQPISANIIAEQQKIADTFTRIGLIPRSIRVADAVLPAPQREALVPR
jgi:sulfonate transport system substrate-binding protein